MPALYRKWRPQRFAEISGQDHIKITLQNSLSGNKIAHAYLFSGPRGTGKTTTARLLAKSVNCQNFKNSEPCNKCSSCLQIQKGENLDLIEIDAASTRGIDDIKDLREKIKFTPTKSKYKVYVIDEAHQLTLPAFNALLKTLEEPPSHVIFILATTEAHKIPPTILSRCQRFDFRRLSNLDLMKRLTYIAKKEGLKIDEEAKKLIIQVSFGSARDAESLLDLIISRGLTKITKKDVEEILGKTEIEIIKQLYEFLLKKDSSSALSLLSQVTEEGKDLFQFTSNLIEFLRQKMLENPSPILVSWIKIFCQSERDMKTASFLQLPLELAIVEITTTGETEKEQIVEKEETLTKKETEKKQEVQRKANPSLLDWNKVISQIRPQNHSLCFVLESCQVIDTKDGQVVLGVDFQFHKDKLQEINNRRMIEEVIRKITGQDYKIVCQVVKGRLKNEFNKSKNERNDSNLIKETEEVFELGET